jgi:hypothetical protein
VDDDLASTRSIVQALRRRCLCVRLGGVETGCSLGALSLVGPLTIWALNYVPPLTFSHLVASFRRIYVRNDTWRERGDRIAEDRCGLLLINS